MIDGGVEKVNHWSARTLDIEKSLQSQGVKQVEDAVFVRCDAVVSHLAGRKHSKKKDFLHSSD